MQQHKLGTAHYLKPPLFTNGNVFWNCTGTSPTLVLHSSALQRTSSIFPSHFGHMSIHCHLYLWSLQPAVLPSHLCLADLHSSFSPLTALQFLILPQSLLIYFPSRRHIEYSTSCFPDHISCCCPAMWKRLQNSSWNSHRTSHMYTLLSF